MLLSQHCSGRLLARSDAVSARETVMSVRQPCRSISQPATQAGAPRLQQQQDRRCRSLVVVSASEAASASATVTTQAPASTGAGLRELTKDDFQSFLDAAGGKVVVVDFFTDWCGPCKLIYPQLVTLCAELEPAATIVKFNCNQYNKDLAKTLGIKVAPTFHIYKNGQKVADMTGAKVDKLRALIDDQLKPKEDGAAN